MCYLPPLIHQLRFGFHPPAVSTTYQSNHFLATFQCLSHPSSRPKCNSDESETSQFMMNSMISDQCLLLRGWAKCEQSVCPKYVTERQLGSVMTSARRACLLYSQRWCDEDETESAWQEREEREQRRVDMNAFIHKCTVSLGDHIYINHIIFSVRLLANKQRLIHVKHVVITHVEHESAPSGPALHVLLVSYHDWNNTAT